jgi:hypothetical protein
MIHEWLGSHSALEGRVNLMQDDGLQWLLALMVLSVVATACWNNRAATLPVAEQLSVLAERR